MKWDRLQMAFFERAPLHFLEHIVIVVTALTAAIMIALPLGIYLTRPRNKNKINAVMQIVNMGQTIPPLAVIAMFLPILGLGFKAAEVALIVYGLLPIFKNTVVGLLQVDSAVKEAARGMGMSERAVLFQVELPLSMPLIIGGIRTSSVLIVSTAVLAGMIGAGGLGRLIIGGLTMLWPEFILVGAGLGALLAILVDRSLFSVEKRLLSRIRA
ncbi:MAG: ABC transporter permease [Dehalobacterium sp.]